MAVIDWTPSAEVATHAGIREVSLRTKALGKRTIFLTGEINTESVMDVILQLMYLREEDKEQPIRLYINSGGGEVNAGLLLYDVLQDIDVLVDTYCVGIAASMAAILFAGGKKGRRYILPHSKVMIHEPLLANGLGGSASSIKNISDSIIETRDIVNGILAKHTGKTKEEIDEATRFDNYMNAEECVEFGLCDKVVNGIF
ncbi:MAG: ATP-dependent Clp protease proteolytic subunit [Lachnospiraceae bacterium]|nr:ATP-dependent Clp protease proteolytic subunit [Lachnospiraceae bacterium]